MIAFANGLLHGFISVRFPESFELVVWVKDDGGVLKLSRFATASGMQSDNIECLLFHAEAKIGVGGIAAYAMIPRMLVVVGDALQPLPHHRVEVFFSALLRSF